MMGIQIMEWEFHDGIQFYHEYTHNGNVKHMMGNYYFPTMEIVPQTHYWY